MSAEDFRAAALTIFGDSYGWQSRLASALGSDRATVSRYLSGQVTIPGPVRAAIRTWLRAGFDPGDTA